MVSLKQYIPEQPFFELSTENYNSRFGAYAVGLAQYYSFVVSRGDERAIVAVPDGTVDILFQCSGGKPEAQICGSVKKGTLVEFERGGVYFGARFFPGTAEALLQCPLNQFTERQILLRDVQGSAGELVERISTAVSFGERIDLFERFYAGCAQYGAGISSLVSYLVEKIDSSNGNIRVGDLAAATGYSVRHISGIFTRTVGISPKLYSRIVRFQRCFGLLRQQQSPSFATLAQDSGYYDQAHLINEFREFSLCTPNQALGACA
ncbi:transcriptional regulator, AraC family [Solidesulfovibrio fructosivorans JJ]]|uniref:Transcriptional regulator, AraC family n=1 Tax=Solidesulfovibrio fructosivorans JJ] TaxID=596151 RepID=E1JST5_SOLFR|nr:helix-turn-helix domain-containing protein [Solidesulfovibrio fructosivorans]EFL52568.1 transcriptional regulator, AraC family [Solidesulfovibrio fructosivorans JJ]]